MTKLNQVIAIEKGIKSKAYSEVTILHKAIQKPDLFNGFQKTYLPVSDDEGEKLPEERKRVQFQVDHVLAAVERSTSELINTTAQKDFTNCVAKANVVLDDTVLFKAAPVSFLLFMEKQMNDMRAFASELPVLDEGEDWKKDENSGLYKAVAVKTHRTKKVAKPLVLYPATPEHPAQTQVMHEDLIAGFWSQVKHSGAMPKTEKEKLIQRIDALSNALKKAREEANMADVVLVPDIGETVFNYLFDE